MAPLLILSTISTSWAYLKTESFKQYFTQDQLILWWLTVNIILLGIFIVLGFQAKVNVPSLWLSIPLVAVGCFLISEAYSKNGIKKIFFGDKFGVIEKQEESESFPSGLGYAQYKGYILLILGLWLSFYHTHEITGITGLWAASIMVQIYVESMRTENVSSQ